MPVLQPQPEIISLEQYETLPADVRTEAFDGELYNMASPSQVHQTILTELLVSIHNYLREKGGGCQVFYNFPTGHLPLSNLILLLYVIKTS